MGKEGNASKNGTWIYNAALLKLMFGLGQAMITLGPGRVGLGKI